MGGTGSTWLAKLLNSHPDVFCSHEAVAWRAFPETNYSADAILRFLRLLAWDTMHGAYAAIGDVGSVWQTHAAGLTGFQTAVLLRHPARILASRLATYPRDQSFTEIHSAAEIRDLWGIDIAGFGPIDAIFIQDLHIFASHVWSLPRGIHLIRIEDLADDNRCAEELRYLTGLDYPIPVIRDAISHRANVRANPMPIRQVTSQFSARQREWYRLFLRAAAPELGYDLDSDTPLR